LEKFLMNRSLLRALVMLLIGAFVDTAVRAADEPAASMPEDHDMSHMSMSGGDSMDHMTHMMMGVLGTYPMNREASGTSWQPDSSTHGGVHVMEGDWMLMGHALLNGVYDWQ
jgi:hypothetical protein